jgi:DNA-binding NarL/FixJ family response regulator
MMIRTLIADDHTIVVEGLRQVLSTDPSFEIVGTAANGEEVLRFLRFHEVDVVVLDINMPVMDGITCAREIKKQFPNVRIVILTMYPQKSFVKEIMSIGIDGCLLKNNTGKELNEAIHRVHKGKQYFDRLHTFNSQEEQVLQHKLSKRELEIVQLLAEGLTSLEMADKLFISEHTVRTHRKNILKKMNMKNASELVQYATQQGLI